MIERIKRVEDYIPDALKILREQFGEKTTIQNKYSGYIASFGASLTQSGLISTLAFYSNKGSDEGESRLNCSDKVDRIVIIQWLEKMLEDVKGETLLNYVLHNQDNEDYIKEDIKRAAIALKLAIRTFKLTSGGEVDG
ncbi:MAG: type III-B CRISPR module-associated protein Cmr5 [Halanaerobiales bacterium]|nr:type III-B CRISPR module-associated protein Cmr5 [Halanaerobiales bacterium]